VSFDFSDERVGTLVSTDKFTILLSVIAVTLVATFLTSRFDAASNFSGLVAATRTGGDRKMS